MGQGLDGDDLADRAVLDEPLGVDVPRVEAAHESYLELDRGALGGLDHVAALVFADRHGLLAQDVLARRCGVDGDLPVVLRRRGDDDGVDVRGQELAVVGEPRDAAEPAARRRERLGARVADRREPRCRDVPLECPGVDEARTARPDHAYANGHGNLL